MSLPLSLSETWIRRVFKKGESLYDLPPFAVGAAYLLQFWFFGWGNVAVNGIIRRAVFILRLW